MAIDSDLASRVDEVSARLAGQRPDLPHGEGAFATLQTSPAGPIDSMLRQIEPSQRPPRGPCVALRLHLVAAPLGLRPFEPEKVRAIISKPVDHEIHVPARHVFCLLWVSPTLPDKLLPALGPALTFRAKSL